MPLTHHIGVPLVSGWHAIGVTIDGEKTSIALVRDSGEKLTLGFDLKAERFDGALPSSEGRVPDAEIQRIGKALAGVIKGLPRGDAQAKPATPKKNYLRAKVNP